MKGVFKQGYKETSLQQTLFDLEPATPIERCAECGKKLTEKDIKYSLVKNGKAKDYCQPCAKSILRTQEKVAEL